MSKNQSEIASSIQRLIRIEQFAEGAFKHVESLLDDYLITQITEDILTPTGRQREADLTIQGLQKHYQLTYARAARIRDELKAKGLIKKENPRR